MLFNRRSYNRDAPFNSRDGSKAIYQIWIFDCWDRQAKYQSIEWCQSIFYDDIVVLSILVILWLFHYVHKTKSRSIFYVLNLNLNRLANLICLPFLLLSEAYSQCLQLCMRRNLICYWLMDLVCEVLFISYQTRYLYSCLFLGCRLAISQFTEMQNYLCRKLL